MNLHHSGVRFAVAATLALLAFANLGAAPLNAPPLPYSPWGQVWFNGVPAPAGVPITAWIGGVQYAHTITVAGGLYALDVLGDDPDSAQKDGGVPGEIVVFRVSQRQPLETGIWASGHAVRLDLTLYDDPNWPRLYFPRLER